MRILSKSEKKVVKKLCEGHQFFSDIFERDFLEGLIIELTSDSINNIYEIEFIVRNKDNNREFLKKKVFEATDKLAQTINLINYLSDQSFIYSFKPSIAISVHGFIGLTESISDYKNDPNNYTRTQYPDTNARDLILEFVDFNFVATEALKDYVSNGFKTSEEIRHRQNLIVAWVAIGISILLGLAGIFPTIFRPD